MRSCELTNPTPIRYKVNYEALGFLSKGHLVVTDRAALAFKTGGKLALRSRNDNDFALRYPSIAKGPSYAPKLKKRTALFEKLREVFRQHVSWPLEVVIAKNQSDSAWLGELLTGRSFEFMFF
jgi:hypothetical protein